MAGTNQREWLNTASWQVWSALFDDGSHQGCYAKHKISTAQGFASVGLSQIDTRSALAFHYSEGGLAWKMPAGTIVLQIDVNAPLTLATTIATDDPSHLYADIGDNGALITQMMTGSVLRISTRSGVRTFSLAGSGQAITTMAHCVNSIAAEAGDNAVAPLPAPITPRAPNIVPLPPATPWRGV
jgi:hypothetical protein